MKTKQTEKKLKKQKGVTIIELVIYLAVIGGIAAMVFSTYASYQSDQKVGNTQQQVLSLAGKIQAAFRGQGDFSGLSPSVAVDLKLIPKTDIDSTGSGIRNQWNSNIDLEGVKPTSSGAWATASGNDAQYFKITVKGVDNNECGKLASVLANSAIRVEINDVKVKDKTVSDELNVVSVSTQCKNGGDDNNLAFIFGRA